MQMGANPTSGQSHLWRGPGAEPTAGAPTAIAAAQAAGRWAAAASAAADRDAFSPHTAPVPHSHSTPQQKNADGAHKVGPRASQEPPAISLLPALKPHALQLKKPLSPGMARLAGPSIVTLTDEGEDQGGPHTAPSSGHSLANRGGLSQLQGTPRNDMPPHQPFYPASVSAHAMQAASPAAAGDPPLPGFLAGSDPAYRDADAAKAHAADQSEGPANDQEPTFTAGPQAPAPHSAYVSASSAFVLPSGAPLPAFHPSQLGFRINPLAAQGSSPLQHDAASGRPPAPLSVSCSCSC